jgi:predicted outer membrane repeat protein
LTAAPPAGAAVFWVGGDAACGYSTIPNALLATILAAGHDEIRIATNQTYTAQAVTISNQSVTLVGGFPSCGSPQAVNGITVLDGIGGSSAPVVTVGNTTGTTHVVGLQSLRLRGGESSGLRISGPVIVSAIKLFVNDNAASDGGGIFLDGAGGGAVVLDTTSSVSTNEATFDGGGIFCTGAGTVASSARLSANEAGFNGGAIRAEDGCTVNVFPDSFPNAELVDNRADFDGGAIAADSGATINLIGSASESIMLEGNIAVHGSGGGIWASGTGTTVGMTDVRLGFNLSEHEGGAVALADGATLEIERSGACTRGIHCSELVSNSQFTTSATDQFGGALAIWNGAQATVSETLFAGNSSPDGGAVAWVDGTGSSLALEGVVVSGHAISGPKGILEAANAATVTATYSTFLNNLDAGESLFRARAGAVVGFYSSLVVDDAGAVFDIASASGDADCLLAHEIGSMPVGATRIGPPTAASQLVVGGPTADPHLLPNSRAIDFCDASVAGGGGPDLDGETRGVDRPQVADLHGRYDLGADEFSDAGPAIFLDGFESGNLSAWSSSTP